MIYCLQKQKGEEWQYDWENSIDFGRAFCGGRDVVGGRGWLAALEVDKLSDAPWSRGDRKRVCGRRMSAAIAAREEVGMRSVKPGRGPSMMGGIGAVIAIVFGIVWTLSAAQMGAPGFFPLFGVLFILVGVVQAVYNFKNAGSPV